MTTDRPGPDSSASSRSTETVVDRACGALIGGFGVLVLAATSGLEAATELGIGPGYFPRLCGSILVALGFAIFALTFRRDRRPSVESVVLDVGELSQPGKVGQFVARALIITASVLAFAFSLERLGLVVSTIALILIASRASGDLGMRASLLLASILAALASLVFIYGLNLPVSAFPRLID